MNIKRHNVPAEALVLGHADRLAQVFINLITNAIKYNDADRPFVEVRFSKSGKRLLIDFQDNGPGIAAKDRRRVFEKFARGQRGATSGQTGSGLGLAISSQIIARLQGKIELVKGEGDGACFRVSLPLFEGEA